MKQVIASIFYSLCALWPCAHAHLSTLSPSTGVARIKCPTLVLGVQSDALFPVWQQQEVAEILQAHGTKVTYYELRAKYGHDTFLIDIQTVGAAVKGHLEALS